jgi:hypothetical protein
MAARLAGQGNIDCCGYNAILRVKERCMSRILVPLVLGIPIVVFGAVSNPAESFFQHTARGGLVEVDDEVLVQQRGSQEARDFGAMMIVSPAVRCEPDTDSEPSGARAPFRIAIRDIPPDQGARGDCRDIQEGDCDGSGCAEQELLQGTRPVTHSHLDKALSISAHVNRR